MQLYTSLALEGPPVVTRVKTELAEILMYVCGVIKTASRERELQCS